MEELSARKSSLLAASEFRKPAPLNGSVNPLPQGLAGQFSVAINDLFELESAQYYASDDSDDEFLSLWEGLLRLCLKKPVGRWLGLSFRELESYLRCENHVPAFSDNSPYEAALIHFKQALFDATINELFGRSWWPLERDWGTMNFVERNRFLSSFFLGTECLKPFVQGELNFLDLDGHLVYFSYNGPADWGVYLENYFSNTLANCLIRGASLKCVAEMA
jgi:hypothetical protein